MVTGSFEPSDPISTSNDVMETVSSEEEEDGGQFLPLLRHGPLLLDIGVGGADGALVTLGLGAAAGEAGLEEEEHEGELELLSNTQVLLLTVSLAPTL